MPPVDDSIATARLTAEDVRILGLESPRVAGHTLLVTVLDHGSAPLDLEALRARVAAHVTAIPRLSERLAHAPGDCLAWEPDPDFAVEHHVRDAPGDGGLRHAVARCMEERLDRDRPLWTLELVEHHAIVLKAHHAMADGVAVRRIATALLWDEQPAAASGHATTVPEPRVRHRLTDVPRLSAAICRELAPALTRSTLARRVGSSRDVAFARASLAELGALRDAFGRRVTINDLVLAATAGGLRRWLEQSGAPLHRMRAKVPVSLHRADEPADAMGNDDGFFFVDLPLREPDPVARLLAISGDCTARKQHADAVELGTLLHVATGLSPAAGHAAVRWSMSPHVFTLNVSNVPGPRGALRVMGRPVAAVYALAEVADWHALRVAVFSAGGTLTFGLCADPEQVEGVDGLSEGIEEELRALVHAAR